MTSRPAVGDQVLENLKLCPCCPRLHHRPDSENLLILSIVQLLCGAVAIILFGVALSKEVHLHQIGTGMWSGSLMLAAGSIGTVTSRHRTVCTLISLLVICVMTAVTSAILASVSIAGLIQDGVIRFVIPRLNLIVIHTLLFIVGLLGLCLAVTVSIICGSQVCFGAIYLPRNSSTSYNLGSRSARNQCSLSGYQQDLHSLANLIMNTTDTGLQSGVLRSNFQLPVLTTHSFCTNVLFSSIDAGSHPLATPCRTDVFYLLSLPSHNETSHQFPPFSHGYVEQETHSLSACPRLVDAIGPDDNLPPYSSTCGLDRVHPGSDITSSCDDIVVLTQQNTSFLISRSSSSSSVNSSEFVVIR